MNKLVQLLLPIGFSAASILPSIPALAATPGLDSLQENAVRSFLQKANDPKTPLHQSLMKLNQADGRNPAGIFPKVLKARDIQIVPIVGSNQFGSYCNEIVGKPQRRKCSRGIYEAFLILVQSKMGVHKATDYQRFLFVVKASRTFTWETDAGGGKFDRKESIVITEPVQVPNENVVPD
jgi:hypothetical protein